MFKGQVAIITGAASGLGVAIAAKLYGEGVRLALLDINDNKLKQVVAEFFPEAIPYALDITNESQIKFTVGKIVEQFGKIHILVNSAGITGKTNIKSHETDTQDIRRVFEVNFFGCYLTSKYVLPKMLEQNYGRILHIASIAGKEGNVGMIGYSSSKAAVIGMTKVQGKEYAD